ncbi:MAG: hypothetical protein ACREE2_02830 [Stellaceae bacterium]
MTDQEIAHRRVDGNRNRRGGTPGAGSHPLGDVGVDITGVEQQREHRVDRLVRLDFIWMHPAKDQEMIILRQMVQCPDYRIETFVSPEKAKNAYQLGISRYPVQQRKLITRSGSPDLPGFVFAEKGQRMIIDVAQSVHISHVPLFAASVHDNRDRLQPLGAAQMGGDTGGQQMRAIVGSAQAYRLAKIEPEQLATESFEVELVCLEYGVERDRKPRSGAGEPGKATKNIAAVAAESAMLELQIDGVELPDFAADLQDVAVGEAAHPGVGRAQQELVQIENRDVECGRQLLFETARISGYPA